MAQIFAPQNFGELSSESHTNIIYPNILIIIVLILTLALSASGISAINQLKGEYKKAHESLGDKKSVYDFSAFEGFVNTFNIVLCILSIILILGLIYTIWNKSSWLSKIETSHSYFMIIGVLLLLSIDSLFLLIVYNKLKSKINDGKDPLYETDIDKNYTGFRNWFYACLFVTIIFAIGLILYVSSHHDGNNTPNNPLFLEKEAQKAKERADKAQKEAQEALSKFHTTQTALENIRVSSENLKRINAGLQPTGGNQPMMIPRVYAPLQNQIHIPQVGVPQVGGQQVGVPQMALDPRNPVRSVIEQQLAQTRAEIANLPNLNLSPQEIVSRATALRATEAKLSESLNRSNRGFDHRNDGQRGHDQHGGRNNRFDKFHRGGWRPHN